MQGSSKAGITSSTSALNFDPWNAAPFSRNCMATVNDYSFIIADTSNLAHLLDIPQFSTEGIRRAQPTAWPDVPNWKHADHPVDDVARVIWQTESSQRLLLRIRGVNARTFPEKPHEGMCHIAILERKGIKSPHDAQGRWRKARRLSVRSPENARPAPELLYLPFTLNEIACVINYDFVHAPAGDCLILITSLFPPPWAYITCLGPSKHSGRHQILFPSITGDVLINKWLTQPFL